MISRPSSRLTDAVMATSRREAPAAAGRGDGPAHLPCDGYGQCQPEGTAYVQPQERTDGHRGGRWDSGLDDGPLGTAHEQDPPTVRSVLGEPCPEQMGMYVRDPEHHAGEQQQQHQLEAGERPQGGRHRSPRRPRAWSRRRHPCSRRVSGVRHGAPSAPCGRPRLSSCPPVAPYARSVDPFAPAGAAPEPGSGGRPLRAVGRCDVIRKLTRATPPVARIAAFRPSSCAEA